MNEEITCSKCGGAGVLLIEDIAPHLSETLELFTAAHPEMTVSHAHLICKKKMGLTAMSARFERLRAMGFLNRRRVKYGYVYFRVKGN